MNYLIVGLGNIGDEYARTRHNIGFMVVDALASAGGVTFDDKRYGFVSTLKVKNQTLTLLKPSTYMNLSGNAVRYWMNELKVPVERVLVVVDDLSLPFGHLRLKPSGSDGGHNGLKRRVWRGRLEDHGRALEDGWRGGKDFLPGGHQHSHEPV